MKVSYQLWMERERQTPWQRLLFHVEPEPGFLRWLVLRASMHRGRKNDISTPKKLIEMKIMFITNYFKFHTNIVIIQSYKSSLFQTYIDSPAITLNSIHQFIQDIRIPNNPIPQQLQSLDQQFPSIAHYAQGSLLNLLYLIVYFAGGVTLNSPHKVS